MKKVLTPLVLMILTQVISYGQAYPDRHNTSWTDAWVSCQETESPNIKRDNGHWILYDFGDQYSLHESTFWNFNVPDSLDKGIQDIVIDYSNDADTWIELGEYTLPQAPGSAFYQGDDGPDFEGVVARYVLISILSNYGDNQCVGLSEMRINATIATSTFANDNPLDVELSAAPNPAQNYTTISLGQYEGALRYSLTDASGRLVRQGRVPAETFQLNVANLADGTYALTIFSDDASRSMMINVIND